MRVWIVNHYALAPDRAGGTRHFELARALRAEGIDASIIAAGFNHWSRREEHLQPGQLWQQEVVEGVPFCWLRTPPYSGSVGRLVNMLCFSLCLWRSRYAGAIGHPDVIVASSPHLFAPFAAERLARRFKVPFVLEVRDLWPQTLIDLGGFSPRHPLIALLGRVERYLYRRADRIISLLPDASDYIAKHEGDPERIVWIPNGVADSSLDALRVHGLGALTVMYVGSHGEANGLDSILDAARILEDEDCCPPVRFRFIGSGPEKDRLVSRAREQQIRSVAFEEPVAKKEVASLLGEADILIATLRDSPLYRYGISLNKIYDYLAAGKPVVFGADSSNNPVSEANAGIVVAPEDGRAMADAVRTLAETEPEHRAAMGRRGREHVAANHSFGVLGRRLADLLRSLA